MPHAGRSNTECRAPACSLQIFADGFRNVCETAILHSMATDSPRAQAVSLVLDYGNQRITALERSSGASTSAPAPPQQQQSHASPEDPFWATADMPDLSAMLSLQVRASCFRHGHAYLPKFTCLLVSNIPCKVCCVLVHRHCGDLGQGAQPRCRMGACGEGRSGSRRCSMQMMMTTQTRSRAAEGRKKMKRRLLGSSERWDSGPMPDSAQGPYCHCRVHGSRSITHHTRC